MTEDGKHSHRVGNLLIWFLILFQIQGDGSMPSVYLAKQNELTERLQDIWLNCSSNNHPFGMTAEFLMNRVTLENVRRTRNGECYRTIQYATCSNDMCFCGQDGKSFGLLYKTGNQTGPIVFGCKMKFRSEDGKRLYSVEDKMPIKVINGNMEEISVTTTYQTFGNRQILNITYNISSSEVGNNSDDTNIYGNKAIGQTFHLHYIIWTLAGVCLLIFTSVLIQSVTVLVIRQKHQVTATTRQLSSGFNIAGESQQYQDLTVNGGEDHLYGTTPFYEELSACPLSTHIYDHTYNNRNSVNDYVDCDDI